MYTNRNLPLKWSFVVIKHTLNVNSKKGTRWNKGISSARKRSFGKVMFLHLSVSHSVHGRVCPSMQWAGGVYPKADTPMGRHPPRQTPLLSRRPLRWPLKQAVHILLLCILIILILLIEVIEAIMTNLSEDTANNPTKENFNKLCIKMTSCFYLSIYFK